MTITGQQPMSLMDSVLAAESTNRDIGVAVLKKAQDAEKQQGEAMVNLLESVGRPSEGRLLDTYA